MLRSILFWCFVMGLAGALSASESSQPADQPLGVDNVWPIQFNFSKDLTSTWSEKTRNRAQRDDKNGRSHISVWLPLENAHIKALMLVPNNTDLVHIAEFTGIRKVARKHSMGIVYFRHLDSNDIEKANPPRHSDSHFDFVCEQISTISGQDHIHHVPWVLLGKSSRGRFAFTPSWKYPERVIASVGYHGEVPTWPRPKWASTTKHSILHMAINGLTEWDGTWYRHVRPSLLNYHRHTNWLSHQVVLYGIDHGDYADYYKFKNHLTTVPPTMIHSQKVWRYISIFLDQSLTLRLPQQDDQLSFTLQHIDRTSGYLIHPRAPEYLLGLKWFAFRQSTTGDYQIIPWPDEPSPVYDTNQGTLSLDDIIIPANTASDEQLTSHLWLPNLIMVKEWLKLHNLYNFSDRIIEELNDKKSTD